MKIILGLMIVAAALISGYFGISYWNEGTILSGLSTLFLVIAGVTGAVGVIIIENGVNTNNKENDRQQS
jgi:hypothetical protein